MFYVLNVRFDFFQKMFLKILGEVAEHIDQILGENA